METLDEVFSFFERRTNLEREPSEKTVKREYRLDRMRRLCGAFGHPESAYKVVHIAGSKGKGSTAALTAELIRSSGERVGVYSSPHLTDYRERFRLAGEGFPEEAALASARRMLTLLPSVENRLTGEAPATTFELLTLFGFILFRDLHCDTVVLETGLGGRLDATNVVDNPVAVIITPVEMEHADILGPRLSDIASEKAGIIKNGVPVWSAGQKPTVRRVVRAAARKKNAPFHDLAGDIRRIVNRGTPFSWRIQWRNGGDEDIELGMGGYFQAENAAMALRAVRSLGYTVPRSARGILKSVGLPGRFQEVRKVPPVILDGAHTPRSILGVLRTFRSMLPYGSPSSILLFGCVEGKEAAAMAKILCSTRKRIFEDVVVSTPGFFKPSNPGRVADEFRRYRIRVHLVPDPRKAWETAERLAGDSRGILITGSFYMAGEIAGLLKY